ncbi:MAG: hypothetical protein K8W52_37230 [Deltaproteobacteria bacterium]|nr:hypothetical protein [Deltaproteobacteria bacterium]
MKRHMGVVMAVALLAPAVARAQPAPPEFGADDLRRGLTFEANLGVGWIHAGNGSASLVSGLSLGGIDLGVGAWLNTTTALTARVAGVTTTVDGGTATGGVIGGSVQHWLDDHLWVSGGVGLGVYLERGPGAVTATGTGLDARIGYTLSTATEHTFNASLEVTPAFVPYMRVTSIALLFGYQHL